MKLSRCLRQLPDIRQRLAKSQEWHDIVGEK